MPCTYYTPEEEATIARKELNKATRAACESLKMLESLSPSHMRALSSDTLVWWKEHKERDVLRKISLNRKESERFVKALKKPKKPTKALKKAAKNYKKAIKSGRVTSR